MESALDAHLRKAHGKDVEANRRRVCVKKKEKKVRNCVLMKHLQQLKHIILNLQNLLKIAVH